MNKLTIEKQKQVVAALVEGNSIRSTVRMTGIAKNTIVKLFEEIGSVCAEYQDKTLRDLIRTLNMRSLCILCIITSAGFTRPQE